MTLFQIGTLAGNLMMKNLYPDFQSDIFLLFECVGATLTIGNLEFYLVILLDIVMIIFDKQRCKFISRKNFTRTPEEA